MARRKERPGRLQDNPQWRSFVAEVLARSDLRYVMQTQAGVVFPPTSRKDGDKVLCPFHKEKTPSCNVRSNLGTYHCFGGCGAEGDAIQFLRDWHGIGFVPAVIMAAGLAGVPVPDEFENLASGAPPVSAPPAERTGFRVEETAAPSHEFILPPSDAPIPQAGWLSVWNPSKREPMKMKVSHVYEYRDGFGTLQGLVVRSEYQGGKTFSPLTWADPDLEEDLGIDAASWVARGYPSGGKRAIYRLEHLGEMVRDGSLRGILFVEGEKCADAGALLLQPHGWAVLSPQGGQNAIEAMDWAAFEAVLRDAELPANLPVVAWPDADAVLHLRNGSIRDRQKIFVEGILQGVEAHRCDHQLALTSVAPPEGKTDGWDIADAIEEDGWDDARLLDWILPAATEGAEAGAADEFGILEDTVDGIATSEAQAIPENIPAQPLPPPPEDELDAGDGLGGGNDDHDLEDGPTPIGNFCRALGYDRDYYYFLPRRKGQIVALSHRGLSPQALLTLAPRDAWLQAFGQVNTRNERRVDWERAYDFLINACHDMGVWSTRNEARAGARMDSGRVVFNSGQDLWIEGSGSEPLSDIEVESLPGSRLVYTVGTDVGRPDVINAYGAGSPEIVKLKEIVHAINWRSENATLYALSFLGWLAIAPICGALTWRPMLWLDGPRGAGKSWIIENIVAKVLGDYAYWVKSNSTESGLRNELNASTLPILFDEAEGEESADRQRMDAILKLARHAATPGDSMVLQGTSGGGSTRGFAIQTTILFSSITPQLRHSADRSRFAQLSLAGGLVNEEFERKLVLPAEELFAARDFRFRFVGRMLTLASKMEETKDLFVKALTHNSRVERRTADVYGTLLAGAFLLTEEAELETWESADNWLSSQGVKKLITDHGEAISEDKDHDRMMSTLLAYQLNVGTGAGNVRTRVGILINIAFGGDYDDGTISPELAMRELAAMGIRVHTEEGQLAGRQFPPGVFFHKDFQPIREALRDTPYASNYEATLRQIDGAVPTSVVRFPGIGTARTIFIPVDGVLRGFADGHDGDLRSAKS